jgi:hypothetical protein
MPASGEIAISHEPFGTIVHVVGITLRSPAGGFSEGERSSPSVLHFKEIRRDEYLRHRA